MGLRHEVALLQRKEVNEFRALKNIFVLLNFGFYHMDQPELIIRGFRQHDIPIPSPFEDMLDFMCEYGSNETINTIWGDSMVQRNNCLNERRQLLIERKLYLLTLR